MMEAGYNRINSVALWWAFRYRRNQALEDYLRLGDEDCKHEAERMQSLMDGCFEDIKNNR